MTVLDPSGAIPFSTRRGGSQDDDGFAIEVVLLDERPLVGIAGGTASLNFPVTPGAFQPTYGGGTSDGFIDVINFDASLDFFAQGPNRSTSFLGGDGFDVVDSLTIGKLSVSAGLKEEVPFWVSSTTSSDGLFISDQAPQAERGGGTDGYVGRYRFDPTVPGGWVLEAQDVGTYAGGSRDESESRIAVTDDGLVVTFQVTESLDFPTTPGVFMEDYPGGPQSLALTVTMFDPDTGAPTREATYFGGNRWDQGPGLAIDPNGGIAITGFTFSSNLPTTPNAIQEQRPGGAFSAFVAWFDPLLSSQYFTSYLGGRNSNLTDLTFDLSGQLYVVGINPAGWPTTPGSFQPGFPGSPFSASLAKISTVFPVKRGLVNGASFIQPDDGGYSSQEIMTGFGGNVGPAEPAALELDEEGKVKRELGGTTVSFNDDIVAMIFASINQTSFVAPRIPVGFRFLRPEQNAALVAPALDLPFPRPEQNGAFATVKFEVDGDLSPVLLVPLVESNPGIFSLNATGQGQGAILNPDFSVNGPDNPAPSGGFIIVYGTGGGIVDPICPDGTLAPGVEPLPRLTLPQRATIDGVEAQIFYAGSAPGLVCGVNQWNIAPTNNPSGPAVAIEICSGDHCTQEGITAAFE